jgi:hypothetical protein
MSDSRKPHNSASGGGGGGTDDHVLPDTQAVDPYDVRHVLGSAAFDASDEREGRGANPVRSLAESKRRQERE